MECTERVGDEPITTLTDFPYDWYSEESWTLPQTCIRYRKSEIIGNPEKLMSQEPQRVFKFGPSFKEGKLSIEAFLHWVNSSSVTDTTTLELGLKGMQKDVAEVSATFKNETSTTRTLGKEQTATFRTEYTIAPRHLAEVFVDRWKVKTRFYTTTWTRQGAGMLHFAGARNPWCGSGLFNFSGDDNTEDCEYLLDAWPRIIALPLGDAEGYKEMIEKQRSMAFKFNWVRFAKYVIVNYLGEDETKGREKVAKLKPGQVEGVVRFYYDESIADGPWEDFLTDLRSIVPQ